MKCTVYVFFTVTTSKGKKVTFFLQFGMEELTNEIPNWSLSTDEKVINFSFFPFNLSFDESLGMNSCTTTTFFFTFLDSHCSF